MVERNLKTNTMVWMVPYIILIFGIILTILGVAFLSVDVRLYRRYNHSNQPERQSDLSFQENNSGPLLQSQPSTQHSLTKQEPEYYHTADVTNHRMSSPSVVESTVVSIIYGVIIPPFIIWILYYNHLQHWLWKPKPSRSIAGVLMYLATIIVVGELTVAGGILVYFLYHFKLHALESKNNSAEVKTPLMLNVIPFILKEDENKMEIGYYFIILGLIGACVHFYFMCKYKFPGKTSRFMSFVLFLLNYVLIYRHALIVIGEKILNFLLSKQFIVFIGVSGMVILLLWYRAISVSELCLVYAPCLLVIAVNAISRANITIHK